jgi:hypothetical protein
VNKIPETPPLENNKIIEEVSEILSQSTQNESKIIEELLISFYTLAELGSFGMTPKHEEQLDKWIDKELTAMRSWAIKEYGRFH